MFLCNKIRIDCLWNWNWRWNWYPALSFCVLFIVLVIVVTVIVVVVGFFFCPSIYILNRSAFVVFPYYLRVRFSFYHSQLDIAISLFSCCFIINASFFRYWRLLFLSLNLYFALTTFDTVFCYSPGCQSIQLVLVFDSLAVSNGLLFGLAVIISNFYPNF